MERLRKRKPRKFRYYAAKYWVGTTFVEDTMCCDSYDEVYRFLYSHDYKILSVKFDGWR